LSFLTDKCIVQVKRLVGSKNEINIEGLKRLKRNCATTKFACGTPETLKSKKKKSIHGSGGA